MSSNWFCWSYDPRTDTLDVWDSKEGREGHYEHVGYEGYRYCAQGRLYDGAYGIIYNSRPIESFDPESSPETIREQGLAEIKLWITAEGKQQVAFHESS